MTKTKQRSLQSIRDFLEPGLKVKGLTETQCKVLTYILQCWASGFMPTYREICAEIGFSSPNAVARQLNSLRLYGYVEGVYGAKTAIMLADKALELVL